MLAIILITIGNYYTYIKGARSLIRLEYTTRLEYIYIRSYFKLRTANMIVENNGKLGFDHYYFYMASARLQNFQKKEDSRQVFFE